MKQKNLIKFNPTNIEGNVQTDSPLALDINLYVNGKSQEKILLNPKNKSAVFNFPISKYLQSNKETFFQVTFNNEALNQGNNFCYYNSSIKKEKIFFLHIPKTAGSSVNKMLGKHFWNKRVKFHIETDVANNYKNINTRWFKMLSGHSTLQLLNQHMELQNFLRVTLLRDPYSQLISHINWVKHIGSSPETNEFKLYSPNIREISLKLNELDFSNIKQVEQFFTNMPAFGHRLFNNRQTRSLLNTRVKAHVLEQSMALEAIKTLHFFDVVGTIEHLNEFIKKIHQRMGWNKKTELLKTNALNNKYRLDQDSESLRKILEPLYSIDQIVYKHVLNQQQSN